MFACADNLRIDQIERMYGLHALTSDILIHPSFNNTMLNVIRLLPSHSRSHRTSAELMCIAMFPTGSQRQFIPVFFRQRETRTSFLVDFVQGSDVYVLAVARNYSSATLERVWNGHRSEDTPRAPDITGTASLRVLLRELTEDLVILQLAARHLAEREDYGKYQRRWTAQNFLLSVQRRAGATTPGLLFDEWTGIGFAPWAEQGDGRVSHATVIVV
jgi:hypothetical protein